MKKLSCLLSLTVILFFGCQKSQPETLTELKAHVISGSDSTTGGTGFYIKLDSSGETVIPINLPTSLQTADAAVAVKFVHTGNSAWSTVPNHTATPVVYLVTIRKL